MLDHHNAVWEVQAPETWPSAPSRMSYSALSELEVCPRRWALSTGSYPAIWAGHGYPRTFHPAALEGSVVHAALEAIAGKLTQCGCSTLSDDRAVAVLRDLGGFTAITADCIQSVLGALEKNPRISHRLEEIRRRLTERLPRLRTRVQSLLARIRLAPSDVREAIRKRDASGERGLRFGSYAEVTLTALEHGWQGVADLLTITENSCEIRDFKTGESKPEHHLQVRIYALLWSKDRLANPTGRLINNLVLSYDHGDVIVPAPDVAELDQLSTELRSRTLAGLDALKSNPPEAKPSEENCGLCSVRHLCDEYWSQRAPANRRFDPTESVFCDLETTVSKQHGPTSWIGTTTTAPFRCVPSPILLRLPDASCGLVAGQVLRLLNVRLTSVDDERGDTLGAAATISSSSEIFRVRRTAR